MPLPAAPEVEIQTLDAPPEAAIETDSVIASMRAALACLERSIELRTREKTGIEERVTSLEQQASLSIMAREDFLAVVSHELRTPLTSILGFLELLLGGLARNPDEEREYLVSAIESAQELHRIINDILEMAELESCDFRLASEPFHLADLLRTEGERHQSLAASKGLTMVMEQPAGELPYVRGDSRKTASVLRHLLSNAVKFTTHGQITLRVGPDVRPDSQRIEVQDTGIGFPPEIGESLTEAFRQAEGHLRRSHRGTGLGLAISYRLVRAMGGELSIRSQGVGTGAVASFTLPVATEFHPAA